MKIKVVGVSFYMGNIEKLLKPIMEYYLPDSVLVKRYSSGFVQKYYDFYCELGEIVTVPLGQLFSGALRLVVKGKVIGSVSKEQKQEVLDYIESLNGDYFVKVWINCNRIKEIVNDEVIVRDFDYYVSAEIVKGKRRFDVITETHKTAIER